MPEWTPVESSIIKAISYENGNLYIKFNSNTMYVYYDVPEDVAQQFVNSDSKGKFLHDTIKGTYDFNRLI